MHRTACPPVVPQTGVIGGRTTANQGVPDDREPTELQKVTTAVLVAKHPVVLLGLVQPAPVALDAPRPGLLGMGEPGVTLRAVEHPLVQLTERPVCDHPAVIASPATNDRV